jgi:hypothetical protein
MLGVYEHERDSYKFPSCWHVVNDVCLPHFHSSIEFVYVTGGELKVTLNGVSSFIKKGQMLIVSSYTVHFYETVTASEAIILIVPLDFIPTYNKVLAQNDFIRNVYQDSSGEGSEILHCMKILSQNRLNDRKLSANIIKGYIYVIIGILIENVGLIHNRNDPNRDIAKDILIYLQDHYLSPVSLQLLAKEFRIQRQPVFPYFQFLLWLHDCRLCQHAALPSCGRAADRRLRPHHQRRHRLRVQQHAHVLPFLPPLLRDHSVPIPG